MAFGAKRLEEVIVKVAFVVKSEEMFVTVAFVVRMWVLVFVGFCRCVERL